MKNLSLKYIVITLFFLELSISSCKKEFLDKKPNTDIVVPETLEDMMQLLDDDVTTFSAPALGFLSADEYYVPSLDVLNSRASKTERNCYTWQTDIYGGEKNIQDWNAPYKSIFQANVVLDQWGKLSTIEQTSEQGKFIKAWALFSRSFAFFNLAQIFSPAYKVTTANIELGIPLKLSANVNIIVQRASLQQTYDQILKDLESSLPLYSNSFPAKNRNRPSKTAVYALLARIYLYMGKYESALSACNNSLRTYNKLIDYNTLDSLLLGPFSSYQDELILNNATFPFSYQGVTVVYGISQIDTALISSYETNDLRKSIFFRSENNSYFMKQGYVGSEGGYSPFTGLAIDEVYLIKAECLARSNDIDEATSVLNELLIKRYKSGTYTPFSSTSTVNVLDKILKERRKELVWRGLRWYDLKRLNASGANITLIRRLDNQTYTLPPNDPKYVMPIPDDEIALSHVTQNQR